VISSTVLGKSIHQPQISESSKHDGHLSSSHGGAGQPGVSCNYVGEWTDASLNAKVLVPAD